MRPQIALDIFKDIAQTIDDAEVVVYKDNKPVEVEQPMLLSAPNPEKKRRPRFKFGMVDIKIGDYVTFDPLNLEVRVSGDDTVEYNDRIYKLSTFVGTYLPDDKKVPSNAYQGAKFFSYKGIVLDELRKKMESESA